MSVNDEKMIEEILEQIRSLTKEQLDEAIKRVELRMKNRKHLEYVKFFEKQDSEKILDENNNKK